MTSDLLPCRCGGTAWVQKVDNCSARAACNSCPASTTWFSTATEAIASWNTRPAPATMAEIVAAAEAWVEIFTEYRNSNNSVADVIVDRAKQLFLKKLKEMKNDMG